MTKQNLKIVKVPLPSSQKSIDRPQVFPRMPRLYLELLENKAKINQDLINKEYSPKKSHQMSNFNDKDDKDYSKNQDDFEDNDKNQDEDKNFDSKLDKFLNKKENKTNINENISNNNSDSDDEYQTKSSKNNNDNDSNSDSDDEIKNKVRNKVNDMNKENNRDNDSDDEIKVKEKYRDDSDIEYKSKNSKKSKNYDSDSDASSVQNLGSRLNELLDDDDNNTVITNDKYSRKYSKHRNYENKYSVSSHTNYNNKDNIPPSLSELEAQGGYVRKTVLRDINNNSYNNQEEEDLKREIMFKIDLLKKSYPNATIPELSIYTDYKSMKQTYDDTVRRLSLDSTVENYKSYLIYGFTLCEFLLGSVFNFDIQGFTQQQILSMNSYEKLLIELGEKSYVPTGSKWPVELRLLFMIIMNAAFFIISKMIMKKTGANLMGMINTMNSTNNVIHTNDKKKKMKGPTIDIDNLPDV
jgi:hypothetical protein